MIVRRPLAGRAAARSEDPLKQEGHPPTEPLPGRAALYGVLAQIEALGLELLEVRRLPPV
jgi:hypothetical protein